jgi:uncharacterized damage-inducible protein DinB
MKNVFFVLCLISGLVSHGQDATIEALVADFERGKTMSLAYIDAMPEEAFGFKPAEGSRSYAEQFLHSTQGTIGLTANGTGATPIYAGQNLEKDPSLQTKAEVTRLVTESFDFAIEAIQNMDPNTFEEIVERGPFKVTRIGWVHKAKEHLNHHRGQAAVYLRLQGIVPPQYKLF